MRRTRWITTVAGAALLATGVMGANGSAGATPSALTGTSVDTGAGAVAPTAYERIVPRPVSAEAEDGPGFALLPSSRIVAPRGAQEVAGQLARTLRRSTGYRLPLVAGRARTGDLVLRLGAGLAPAGHAQEGYTVDVGPITTIAADRAAGLNLGVQTLRQLLPVWADSTTRIRADLTVPAGTVSDYPRFTYRAAMLDVARSFLTVDEVKSYVDTMVSLKANTLHLHLTDDQAWRIAINTPRRNPSGIDYGQLITVGSDGAAEVYGGSGDPLGTEPGLRGSYTQRDYRAIVAYAAARHVTVIPEIDGPGHTNAALASIPQLNPDGITKPMNNTADVGYSTLDANSEVSYEFLRTVFGQLAAMTPGPYLHIGGDEAHVTGHDNYLTYMDRAVDIATDLGKLPMGWNEYAEGDLPEGSLVQYWTGSLENTIAQANRGAKVVMSPASTAYLDQKPFSDSPIGLSWACSQDCDWDTYYDWNPVPTGLTEDQVAGVEAPLWSETVRGLDQARWLALPRLASVLEIGWTQESRRDVTGFGQRLATLGSRMVTSGQNFYASPAVPWVADVLGVQARQRSRTLNGVLATVAAPGAAADDVVVSIDYGDGSPVVPGAVTQAAAPTSLSVGSVMQATAPPHRYAAPGTYSGTVTVTVDGRQYAGPFGVTIG